MALVAVLVVAAPPVSPGTAFAAAAVLRVGQTGAMPTDPALHAKKVKLGTATRSALEVPPDFSFQVSLTGGWRQLIFSSGILSAGSSGDRVEFSVSAGRPGHWRPVFSRVVSADAQDWTDHVVSAEAVETADEFLQFSTARRSVAAGDRLRAFWGSILIEPLPHRPEPAAGESHNHRLPNVIMISLDTLGAKHVGWYGRQPSVSPRLDAFLDRAFTFRRAYAHYPNTLVSHASLFSSLYPNRHHLYGHPATLRSETLAEVLAAHGYMTVGITEDAFVSSDFGFDKGFDWYDDGHHVVDEFPGTARETFDKATRWLRQFGGREPYFLFVHTYEVHTPYVPRDDEARATLEKLDPEYSGEFRDLYPGGELEVKHNRGTEPLSPRDIQRLVALHASEIQYTDRIFGEFIDQLSELSSADDTLVVLLSDHGDEFDEHGKIGHGETLHDPVLHVPLAFYWPRRISAGEAETRVQLIDVAPTVLDLVGVPKPSAIDGQTMAPVVLGGDATRIARPIFAELRSAWASCRELSLADDCKSEHYAVLTERFKYITSMIPWSESLYDLSADPNETRNVAAEFPQEVQSFRKLLADYVINQAAVPDFLSQPDERVAGDGPTGADLDDVTRERLKALGYNP